MEIEERAEGDVTILLLSGKMVDGEDDGLLREKVEDLVEAGKINIVFDLAGVHSIDSGCLGELVRCFTTVSLKNGSMKLMNPSQYLQQRFGLASVFDEHDDDDPDAASGVTSLGMWARVMKIRRQKS